MKYDIIIIGGGASGMMAAIHAAMGGTKVCVIEHNDRVGKKILSTGNGKCNLTNMDISEEYYSSSSQCDFYRIVRDFMPGDLIGYMASIGLYTKSKNGYVYPASEQASSVLDALRFELQRLSVKQEVSVHIKSCRKKGADGFEIVTDNGNYVCQKLIIATGSKAASKTGSDGSGYDLAKSFGHSIVDVVPALVQMRCRENFFKELHGVRVETKLELTADGESYIRERGELQLTDYGISGIPVFQMSGKVKRLIDFGARPIVHIDFCPDYTDEELDKMLHSMLRHNTDAQLVQALCGLLNKKLANVIIKYCRMCPSVYCADVTDAQINLIAAAIKNFAVTPYDTNGFENAQVCSGGVRLDEMDLDTMESGITKGLYFAGEILDVDGRCGGYNLHWAFASGRLAGISAAEALNNDTD